MRKRSLFIVLVMILMLTGVLPSIVEHYNSFKGLGVFWWEQKAAINQTKGWSIDFPTDGCDGQYLRWNSKFRRLEFHSPNSFNINCDGHFIDEAWYIDGLEATKKRPNPLPDR